MEIEGVKRRPNSDDHFPFSGLRLLGGIQIFLGVLCILLGIIDLVLLLLKTKNHHHITTSSSDSFNSNEGDVDEHLFQQLQALTLACTPVWCGTWFVVTGGLGSCISQRRAHSLKFLKISFLVLSTLCAAFFGPACTVMSCVVAFWHHRLDYSDPVWLVSGACAFLALCQTGLAIISASVCCCCSPLSVAKVHIIFTDNDSQRPRHAKAPDSPSPQLLFTKPPETQHRTESKPIHKTTPLPPRLRDAAIQTKSLELGTVPDRLTSLPHPVTSFPHPVTSLPHPVTTLPPLVYQPPRPLPEVGRDPSPESTGSETRANNDLSGRGFGYRNLRRWALPHNVN